VLAKEEKRVLGFFVDSMLIQHRRPSRCIERVVTALPWLKPLRWWAIWLQWLAFFASLIAVSRLFDRKLIQTIAILEKWGNQNDRFL